MKLPYVAFGIAGGDGYESIKKVVEDATNQTVGYWFGKGDYEVVSTAGWVVPGHHPLTVFTMTSVGEVNR